MNRSADGLVEIAIEPPCHLSPNIDNLFGIGPSKADSLTVSLSDQARSAGQRRSGRSNPVEVTAPRANAPHLVALVRAGGHFERGVLVEPPETTAA